MKLLHYLPYSYHIHTGGVEKIAQTIANGLAKEDIESLIIASDVSRGHKKSSLEDFSNTIFIPSFDLVYNFPFPKFWRKEFRQHFKTIQQYKPDIIITHTRFFVQSLVGGIIAKRLGVKRIHIEHGSGFVKGYSRYIKFCARLFDWTFGLWIFRQCDQIVTISQSHKSFIAQFTNKEPVVIYNPIDYIPQKKIKNDIPHIGFVGRLVSLKGVDLLIQALSNIQDKQRTCTIVGDGSERQKLEDLTQLLGLAERIVFVGADDRSNWLHKFDVFVNPSHQEGLPTTVVEALLAQCIVVATDVGGTREISDHDDLILVQPEIGLIEKGIEKALGFLDKSGNSYEGMKEKFGIKNALQKYKKLLKPKKKRIIFVAPREKGGTYYYYEQLAQYIQGSFSDLYDVRFIHDLWGYIKFHFISSDVIFSILPFFFKPLGAKRYVYNLHGNYKTERKNKSLGTKLLYLSEFNLGFADKIMLTSYYLADKLHFRKKYKDKTVIVPNFIDRELYEYPQREFDESCYKILTVTSFAFYDKGKGIINIKKAIEGLSKQTDKKIIWTIVGNDDSENFEAIKKEFDTVEITSPGVDIQFVGWKKKEEIIELYKENDWFLYWTELDNYPGVVLEAIASGMKVLVNNYESFPYFLPQEIICNDEISMASNMIMKYPYYEMQLFDREKAFILLKEKTIG